MHISTMTCLMYSARNETKKTPALEAARRLKAAGFSYLDLFLCGLVKPVNASFSGDNWLEEVHELRQWAVQHGVVYHQCHLPYYYPGPVYNPDETEFNPLFDKMMRRGIEICAIMGIKHAVVHPVNAPGADPEDTAAHVAENQRFYSEYLDLAAEKGVYLAFENLGSREKFGSRTEDLIALMDAMQGKNAAVCWDVGHGQRMYGDDNAAAIETMGSRIVCLHVHDNKGILDEHLPPFMGKIRWESIMAALKKAGYKGELNYEVSVNGNIPDLLRDETARYCAKAGEFLVKMFDEA